MEKEDQHALPQPIPYACFSCAECLMPHLHWRTCPKLLAEQQGGGGGAAAALPPLPQQQVLAGV